MEREFWRLHVLLCCCAANQYREIAGISWKFQSEEHVLRVNKSKITGENTFNGDHFEIQGNHESSKDEKTLFCVFLQICDRCFKGYLRYKTILCHKVTLNV